MTANVSSRIRFRSGKSARQRERRGERDGAAQAGPADDEREPCGEPRVAPAICSPWRFGQQARGEDPDEPRDDDDQRRPARRGRRSRAASDPPRPCQDRRQLQPDQHEHEPVEDEPDHLPGGQPQDPAARRQDRPQPAADDEARGDRREHAGQPELLGRQVRGERDDERDQRPRPADRRAGAGSRAATRPTSDPDRDAADRRDRRTRRARRHEHERAARPPRRTAAR